RLDLGDGDGGLDVDHAGKLEQDVEDELLIPFERRREHLDENVHLAEQGMAFEDLGNVLDTADEVGALLVGQRRHLQRREDEQRVAELLADDQRDLALDVALVLQPLQAAPAGRLREADALGELAGGERGILLDLFEDSKIDRREFFAHRIPAYDLERAKFSRCIREINIVIPMCRRSPNRAARRRSARDWPAPRTANGRRAA